MRTKGKSFLTLGSQLNKRRKNDGIRKTAIVNHHSNDCPGQESSENAQLLSSSVEAIGYLRDLKQSPKRFTHCRESSSSTAEKARRHHVKEAARVRPPGQDWEGHTSTSWVFLTLLLTKGQKTQTGGHSTKSRACARQKYSCRKAQRKMKDIFQIKWAEREDNLIPQCYLGFSFATEDIIEIIFKIWLYTVDYVIAIDLMLISWFNIPAVT